MIFFALSVEDRFACNDRSISVHSYNKSQTAYEAEGLLGSPEKDIRGANIGKVIGAEVNSTQAALDRGLCTLGAPIAKRISMSFITLAVCQLAFTTDALHLCLLGGWVSMLGFRRPLMALLRDSYHVVDQNKFNSASPRLVKLTRAVATELTLLAVLMPLACFDLGAQLHEYIYCADASLNMGAICRAKIPERTMWALWKSCKSKGSYTQLASASQSILRRCDLIGEDELAGAVLPAPSRPLAYHFDFLEVFAGAALITSVVAGYGFSCGQPVDLSLSEEFSLEWVHVISWITFMLANNRLRGVMLSPPCTSFSIMRRPRLRSPATPYGFDLGNRQTMLGNVLACRAFQMFRVAYMNGCAAIIENPFSSYAVPAWLGSSQKASRYK